MIGEPFIGELKHIRLRLYEQFNAAADMRDDLPSRHVDKPQWRAVASQLEKALASVDSAIDKAKL